MTQQSKASPSHSVLPRQYQKSAARSNTQRTLEYLVIRIKILKKKEFQENTFLYDQRWYSKPLKPWIMWTLIQSWNNQLINLINKHYENKAFFREQNPSLRFWAETMFTTKSRSFQRGTMGLCRSKGCNVTSCQIRGLKRILPSKFFGKFVK